MTQSWTYASNGGEAYPVQPGELWRAGAHRLACGDLQRDDGLALLAQLQVTPDLVYTDPPWNAGNAASFRTKAATPGKVEFGNLMLDVLAVAKQARRYAFIEMGRQNAALLTRLVTEQGGVVLAQWPITYYRRHPAALLCCTWTGQPAPAGLDLSGRDDEHTPMLALGAVMRPGDVVCDPCTGRGLTARTAEALGLRFVGTELSPWRMSCALHSLHQCGLDVQREGLLAQQAVHSA